MNNNPSLPSVVFFGTPEFARFCLASLVDFGFPILAVVTAPDRKAGRGKKITSSAVKDFALAKEIPILQPTNLKESNFLNDLQDLNADIFAVVAFRMLPKAVWNLAPLGTINLHASLLPDYKGAAPINWVIINGETETGVTTFLINEAIDSGALLMRKNVPITDQDNFGSLHDKLLSEGAPLLCETLFRLAEKSLNPNDQIEQINAKSAPKLNSENCQIQWDRDLKQIVNQIRGLNPYPGAWTSLRNNGDVHRIKIYVAEAVHEKHELSLGKVLVRNSKLMIATQEGFINCIEIQLPNKKRMNVSDLLNGYSVGADAHID